MNTEFEYKLAKYADVIVKVGLNLQPGQRLMIGAPFFGVDGTLVQFYPLVRQISRAAYQAGAKYVAVNWDDEELQRIRLQHAAVDSFDEYPLWKNTAALEYLQNCDAMLALFGQNPDLLDGFDQAKLEAKQATETPHFHQLFSSLASGMTNWLVASPSHPTWATKIFPNLGFEEATDRLWDVIFEACRIDHDDPIAEWERHIGELAKRTKYLQTKNYDALHYTAPGTDLTVGLPAGHLWHSGKLASQNGIEFVANIPTEEVFTMPHKDRVNGTVRATKPLNYGGLIEEFTLEFAAGRVVNAVAEKGQATLDMLLNTDDASRYLGEVALVPHSSPISQSELLFYNILFDENASNHLALGNAYRFSMQDGEGMSPEEFAEAGGNESMTHADFMMGSDQMDVDGITADGDREPVMRNGEWAFDV